MKVIKKLFYKFTAYIFVAGLTFFIANHALAYDDSPYLQRDGIKSSSNNLNIDLNNNSGAFAYTYPIEIPAGRNSLQPDLQLNYNSHNRDKQNLFGYGWSTSIPYIERIAREGTDELYTTNYFNSSLSGELVETSVSDIYASKVETGGFFSYEYVASTHSWLVKDKQGVTYKFGLTTTTRQDNPSDSTEIYKWMLEEVRDTNDNFIRYEYYKDSGQIYPYKIFYTGYGAVDGIFEIEFLRESRTDNGDNFSTGFTVNTNYRISSIEISSNNQVEKKYDLNYIVGDNNFKSLLDNAVENARDPETGLLVAMPEEGFGYLGHVISWTEDTNYNIPTAFVLNGYSEGVRLVDVNGDGFVDILKSGGFGNDDGVYINNTDGTGWTEDTNYVIPAEFIRNLIKDTGVRLADVNGDGFVDIVQSEWGNPNVYINNGDGTGWTGGYRDIPVLFTSNGFDRGVRLADVDGDGLADIIKSSAQSDDGVYINNSNGNWVKDWSYSSIPFNLLHGTTRLADIDGDGLVDAIKAQGSAREVYINNGDGTGWTEDTNYNIPFQFLWWSGSYYEDTGTRLADFNGDGLIDVLQSQHTGAGIYINNGDGTGWSTAQGNYGRPFSFFSLYDQGGVVADVNGDGYADIVQSLQSNSGPEKGVYINNTNDDILNLVNTQKGSQINIDYQASAQATSTSGLLNPDLHFVVQTVKQITIDDGLGNESIIDYEYSDGQFYYNTPYDKKFAGFGKVEKVESDSKTISYYHQGDTSNSSQGEYNDGYYKIGKKYRQEMYDVDTDSLLKQEIYKWEEYDQGDGNKFVYNTQKSITNFVGTAKSIASQMQYNTSTGNLEIENNLGEVTINTGTGDIISQLAGDEKNVDYQYAENIIKHILAAPKTRAISDATDSKNQDIFYNNQTHGQVDKLNITKEEYENNEAEINRKFNSYGLAYEQSDPEFSTTTIAYDSYNMYPASSTDPLGNTSYMDYNLLNGQVATSTAPNGAMTVNKFDAFGRPIEIKISDSDNPTNLVLKQEISYQDITLPRYKEVKDYFDTSSYITSREYYDGLDRIIQTKTDTATTDEYTTVDINYDDKDRVDRESLPYITSSISNSLPDTTKPAKTYTHDSLDRVLTEITPVGTTSYQYDGFKTTIIDVNGNQKDLTKDAHGNLIEVKEYNEGATYTTGYEYTLTNKLKKITDEQGNIRNFHYDELDNLDWQDMIHKSTVTTPEKINYTHDKNSNVLTETSFKDDTISYTYDDLNRVEYEKLSDINQISYTYDQNGDTGFLTYADYGNNNKKYYDYDVLGNLRTSTTTIENENFIMSFDYNLNGDIKEIIYPNDWVATYGFNSIGQVDEVSLDKGAGATILVENIEYNQNGQMTHLERSNGVDTDYLYDPLENFRLTHTTSTIATTTLQDISYTYDNVGNITNITDNADADLAKDVDYDYDDLYRLATSTVSYVTHSGDNYTRTYDYDEVGNMIYNSNLGTMNYNNDNPHQLSGYGTRIFVYDDAGNQRYNGGFDKFFWDHRSRLKSTYDITSEDSTYYEYDHSNQRFLKYTNSLVFIPPDIHFEETPIEAAMGSITMAAGGGTWELRRVKEDKYIDSYFEQDLNNNTKTHLFLNSSKIATINNNASPYFILTDHLGSSSLLVDNSGNIKEQKDYYPYGDSSYENITTDMSSDYDFTGKETDEETNTQYFINRYYDNEFGKFLSIDPLLLRLNKSVIYDKLYYAQYSKDGNFNNLLITLKADKKILRENDLKKESYYYFLSDPQNLNSYAYVTNNPIVYVDLDGEVLVGQVFSGFKHIASGATQYVGTVLTVITAPATYGATLVASPWLFANGSIDIAQGVNEVVSGFQHESYDYQSMFDIMVEGMVSNEEQTNQIQEAADTYENFTNMLESNYNNNISDNSTENVTEHNDENNN